MTWPFENDTSKVVALLARRSLQADKRRNVFVVLTIALTTALLSGMLFVVSAGQRELEADIRGQYQAVVVDCTQAEIDHLAAQPEIEQWGLSQSYGTVRYQDSNLLVEYADENWMVLGKKPSFTGQMPTKANEILVEQAFLEYFGLPQQTGQAIRLDLGSGEQDYIITGILQAENTSRLFSVVVSRAFVEQQAAGEPVFEFRFRFIGADRADVEALRADIAAFLASNGIEDGRVFYSSNYFDMQGFRNDSDRIYLLIAAVFLTACGLVIYSIFYISVCGKLREYGRLKVIGATPRQIKKVIRRESMWLSLRSIPVGLLVGGIAAFIGNPAYWDWLGNLPVVVVTILFTEIVVLLSTSAPVRLAAKVSPIEAVRTSGYQADVSAKNTRRPGKHISPGMLARMNFQRSPKKAVLTLVSLSMTGVFLLCAATLLHSINANNMAASSMGDGCNYAIQWGADIDKLAEASKNNPLTLELREKILAVDGVESLTVHSGTGIYATLPNGTSDDFEVHVLNRQEMAQYLPEDALIEGTTDYDRLMQENGLVITDSSEQFFQTYWDYTPKIGDVITLKPYGGEEMDFTILGIADGNFVAENGTGMALFTLPEDAARQLYPDVENMEIIWNVFTTEDTDALRQELFSLLEDPLLDIISRSDYALQMEVYLKGTQALIYGLLVFLFLFSLVNLVNTLLTNLFSRQQEFGILQSVGMSGRQLSQMLTMECLYYVAATLLITLVFGGLLGAAAVIVVQNAKIFGMLVYQFPVGEFFVFAAALLLVQILYSVFAVRYMRRQSLVDRIKTME